ncbi:hypothetical protein CFC21_032014 [Triticum aestivum]|uniref:Fe2OG dioxygenase domain-containing protein n=2 Tax=Triticum aestivum TaxID=4565 RepID=A0A9R1JII9_WHEAT|nr:hypothetical protein CFC21_032014 [Triticum aestivum]
MASDSDRLHALKAFDDTKAGVKGLVDAGITTIPSIFHHPLPLLHRGHLEEDAACLEGFAGHYYPSYPEPHLTLGTTAHSDPCFLIVVLQNAVGGLQVLVDGLQEDDKKSVSVWVDVPAVPGALVVNIGDFRQLVSNGKFRSVEHRVVAKSAGPRVSVACCFRRQGAATSTRVLRPIVADGEAQYRSTTMAELVRRYRAKRLDGSSLLQNLRLLIHPIKTTS